MCLSHRSLCNSQVRARLFIVQSTSLRRLADVCSVIFAPAMPTRHNWTLKYRKEAAGHWCKACVDYRAIIIEKDLSCIILVTENLHTFSAVPAAYSMFTLIVPTYRRSCRFSQLRVSYLM